MIWPLWFFRLDLILFHHSDDIYLSTYPILIESKRWKEQKT